MTPLTARAGMRGGRTKAPCVVGRKFSGMPHACRDIPGDDAERLQSAQKDCNGGRPCASRTTPPPRRGRRRCRSSPGSARPLGREPPQMFEVFGADGRKPSPRCRRGLRADTWRGCRSPARDGRASGRDPRRPPDGEGTCSPRRTRMSQARRPRRLDRRPGRSSRRTGCAARREARCPRGAAWDGGSAMRLAGSPRSQAADDREPLQGVEPGIEGLPSNAHHAAQRVVVQLAAGARRELVDQPPEGVRFRTEQFGDALSTMLST